MRPVYHAHSRCLKSRLLVRNALTSLFYKSKCTSFFSLKLCDEVAWLCQSSFRLPLINSVSFFCGPPTRRRPACDHPSEPCGLFCQSLLSAKMTLPSRAIPPARSCLVTNSEPARSDETKDEMRRSSKQLLSPACSFCSLTLEQQEVLPSEVRGSVRGFDWCRPPTLRRTRLPQLGRISIFASLLAGANWGPGL